MGKLIHIYDVKPLSIFEGGKTRGPITFRVDESIIGKLLKQLDGPKDMFAVNPENKDQEIRLTLENYMVPENELFGKKEVINEPKQVKEPVKEEVVVEDVKEEEPVQNIDEVDDSMKTLAALMEEDKIKEEPVKEEVVVEDVKEEEPVQNIDENKPKENNNNTQYNKNNYNKKKNR